MAVTHFYKLNDNAANTTVVATTGPNGTLQGGEVTSVVQNHAGPGNVINYAFDLNGTDDYVSPGSNLFRAGSASMALSVWVKMNGADTGCAICGNTTSNNSGIWIPSTGTLRMFNSPNTLNFTIPTLGSSWHHIMMVRAGSSNTRVWVDGVESVTGSLSYSGNWSSGCIGRMNGNYHDGKISQLRFYDSDETANVATLYAEGAPQGPNKPVILHHFNMLRG